MSKNIIYFCFIDNDLTYIGRGQDGREFHLNTGMSHVYEANRAHFEGKEFKIHKFLCSSKEESIKLEKDLIRSLNPLWNKQYNANNPRVHYSKVGDYCELDESILDALFENYYSYVKCLKENNDLKSEVQALEHTLQELKESVRKTPSNFSGGFEEMTVKQKTKYLISRGFKLKEVAEILGKSLSTIKRYKRSMGL